MIFKPRIVIPAKAWTALHQASRFRLAAPAFAGVTGVGEVAFSSVSSQFVLDVLNRFGYMVSMPISLVQQMLPHWGSRQREATEGVLPGRALSTTALRAAVPLPQRGRVLA